LSPNCINIAFTQYRYLHLNHYKSSNSLKVGFYIIHFCYFRHNRNSDEILS
jgi:hypothetical protein